VRTGSEARPEEGAADSLRSFVAAHVPDGWVDGLTALRERLARHAAGVRWVQPDGSHVTLAFLGQIARSRVPAIVARLNEAARECPPCRVRAGGIGVFPHPGRATVLWLGVTDPSGGLTRLQRRVEQALSPEGFAPDDRPFHPHVTVGRWRTPPPRSNVDALLAEAPLALSGAEGEWIVADIRLMESRLTPKGPIYTVVEAIPLTGSAAS
jgi:2'-5' RNA ligase